MNDKNFTIGDVTNSSIAQGDGATNGNYNSPVYINNEKLKGQKLEIDGTVVTKELVREKLIYWKIVDGNNIRPFCDKNELPVEQVKNMLENGIQPNDERLVEKICEIIGYDYTEHLKGNLRLKERGM
jgi:hypothetical protein